MSVPRVFHGDVVGTREAYGSLRGRESLSGSPSSVIIWSRSVCARRGERAGEEGCRTSELGMGEVYGISPSFCGSVYASCFVGSPRVRRYLGAALVCASFPLGGRLPTPLCRLGLCGCGSVLVGRVRIVPCTWYRGGRRSASLGQPLGRLAAVAACMSGVWTPSSRLWIEVMTKP